MRPRKCLLFECDWQEHVCGVTGLGVAGQPEGQDSGPFEVLKQHYEPVTLVIAEWFTFHRRCQQPGESVAEFAAELKKLSKFGIYLDDSL